MCRAESSRRRRSRSQTALNKQFKTTTANQIHVAVIPTSRDQLLEALQPGRGDVIAAGITMTPEREKIVDFTVATKSNVREIVVTGPGAPALASLDDLAGKEIAVRNGSIQFESLQKLNETFKQQGKAPVKIRTVPTSLEDEDILEMANAGLLPIVVVRRLLRRFLETDPAQHQAAPGYRRA